MKKFKFLLVVVFLTLMVLFPVVRRGSLLFALAQGAGKITFASDRDRDGRDDEIYVMNDDGSNQTRLTDNWDDDSCPAWSPDGTRIAFHSNRDRNGFTYEIYVMNADGSNQTRLTYSLSFDGRPSWSPDGKRIAFQSSRDGNSEIYVMNADGSGQTCLTHDSGHDTNPAWSPDGKRIAFDSYRNWGWGIFVMNVDGTNQTRLTNDRDTSPTWSPDGRLIAFERVLDGLAPDTEIYVMNADGSNQRCLTNNTQGWDCNPSWSPDGWHITFESSRDGDDEIYIMDADGANQRNLTSNSAGDRWPAAWATPEPCLVEIEFTNFVLLTDQDDMANEKSELFAVLVTSIGGETCTYVYPNLDPGYITVDVEPGVPFSIPQLTFNFTRRYSPPLPGIQFELYVMEIDSNGFWQTMLDISGGLIGAIPGALGGPIGAAAGAVTGVTASKFIQELAGFGDDYLGHIIFWIAGSALKAIADSGKTVSGELEDCISPPDFKVSYTIKVTKL